jgi:hypothetical protein
MSEETPPIETPTETTAPAETPAPEADAPAPVNLDQKIMVNGEELSPQQILDQQRELEALRKYRDAASNLMKAGDNELNEAREQNIRYVMSQEGYEPDQINGYVEQLRQASAPQITPHSDNTSLAEEVGMTADPRVDDMAKRMAVMEEREKEMRVNELRSKLETASTKAVGHKDLTSISDSFKRIHGDDGHQDRMDVINEEVHKEILSQLRRARAGGAEINDSIINQASENAAQTVAKRYRTVIGDPNKLGRAPETASGNTQFYQKKPVELPKFQPGKDTTGTVYDKARKFAEDSLLDIAADVSSGGNTKL